MRHAALGSLHALKVLRPELAADAELRARFLAEGRVQAQVRHPHIAVVTDVVVEEGVAALVMELLVGGTLEARIAEGPLSGDDVARLLAPVCDAVASLHQRGVVHRDIKSSNLMFRDVARTTLAVSDFGIARVEDGALAGGRAHRTRTGHLLGTPAYMSPEQVRGRPVDGRSDVFSLGVVAWEMLTGVTPFERESDFETMAAVVEGRRERLHAPGAPAALV
ncbi:MAG TPA: serine/threonine-protein kinase, partial [Myxococcota bacterium]|nr:serine/threonine-protein kinase [Myxococcota bacterium]